jgi:chromosome segregation ATPase
MRVLAVLCVVIFAIGGVGYWYWKDSQSTISTLTENNAKLETAVETSEATINQMQSDFAALSKELNRVNQEFAVIRRQNSVLSEKLQRHDIGQLGNARPGLVERAINEASDNVSRCFELLSGSELTDKEKKAENGQQFNSECPWLYDSLGIPSRMSRE